MPKKQVWVDLETNLGEIFEKAHNGTAEIYGLDWFNINRAVIHALENSGFEPYDAVIKTVSSLTARVVMDGMRAIRKNNTALESVLQERSRQEEKWGQQNHDPFLYQAILQEETGEAAQAALELRFGSGTLEHLREESIHAAAVALAIVECLDRDKWGWSDGTPKPKPHEWDPEDGKKNGS